MKYSTLDGDALLRTEEVADWMRVSKSYLDKARVSGTGPSYVKLDKNVRYKVGVIRNFLAQVERSSTRTALATGLTPELPDPHDIIRALLK